MLLPITSEFNRKLLAWLIRKPFMARLFLIIPLLIFASLASIGLGFVDLFYGIWFSILIVFGPQKIKKKYLPFDFSWDKNKN